MQLLVRVDEERRTATLVINGMLRVALDSERLALAAKDLTITNCVHHQQTVPGTTGIWINLIGADRARIENNRFVVALANNANSTIIGSQTAAVDILVANTICHVTNTVAATLATLPVAINFNQTNVTGAVMDCRVVSGITNVNLAIALAGMWGANNYSTHTANKNGILCPAVDS